MNFFQDKKDLIETTITAVEDDDHVSDASDLFNQFFKALSNQKDKPEEYGTLLSVVCCNPEEITSSSINCMEFFADVAKAYVLAKKEILLQLEILLKKRIKKDEYAVDVNSLLNNGRATDMKFSDLLKGTAIILSDQERQELAEYVVSLRNLKKIYHDLKSRLQKQSFFIQEREVYNNTIRYVQQEKHSEELLRVNTYYQALMTELENPPPEFLLCDKKNQYSQSIRASFKKYFYQTINAMSIRK